MRSELAISEKDILALRKIQLRLLNEVDRICKKYRLTYWIDFGTLLGAVRNGGFIPWDDDIDISMPLADLDSFLTIAKHELPKDIFIQTNLTDPGYKQTIVKLRDCNSTFIEHHEHSDMPYHQGIFLDIFAMYGYPKMPLIFRRILQYLTVRSRSAVYITRKKLLINYFIYIICRFSWGLLGLFKTYALGQIPEDNGYMYATPLKYIYPLRQIMFEGGLYPCPKNYDLHLKSMYGEDYLIPPKEISRIPHAKIILVDVPCNHKKVIKND
jgi:lipopolysaccharide cholinephosphotransferase